MKKKLMYHVHDKDNDHEKENDRCILAINQSIKVCPIFQTAARLTRGRFKAAKQAKHAWARL